MQRQYSDIKTKQKKEIIIVLDLLRSSIKHCFRYKVPGKITLIIQSYSQQYPQTYNNISLILLMYSMSQKQSEKLKNWKSKGENLMNGGKDSDVGEYNG